MRNRSPHRSLPGPFHGWLLRAAVPCAALSAFGGMALLWVSGFHGVYFGVLRFLQVTPFRFPLLDTQFVLAAAQCSRHGFNVYVSNPCDVLGRLYDYSPLWLAAAPHWLGTADTFWVGALLDLAFLSSLGLVMRPRSGTEVAIFALAVFSQTTVFTLERANADLMIFLLILYANAIDGEAPARRASSYFLYLTAGLLKYYPLVLLVLLVRNSRRVALLYGGAMFSALLAFAFHYRNQIAASLANVPKASCHATVFNPSYLGNTFSAKDLPFGIACGVGKTQLMSSVIAAVLFLVLLAVTGTAMWQNLRSFEAAEIDWAGNAMQRLALGSILITACFFAGTNIVYRDIVFLFVIPGLVRLRLSTKSALLRRRCSWLIAVVLLLMWDLFLREKLGGAFAQMVWVVREVLWWWLIAALAAIAVSYLGRQPLVEEGMAGLRRLRLRLTAR
jgi:hypothetical protein